VTGGFARVLTAPRKHSQCAAETYDKNVQKQGKPGVSAAVTERDSVVQRTPHMEFSCDEPLMPETAFDITIFADQQQREPERSSGIVINAPRKVRDFKWM